MIDNFDKCFIDKSRPLFPAADAHYENNAKLLEKLKSITSDIVLQQDGISIKSGYFFYIYMKLVRGVASANAPGRDRPQKIISNLRKIELMEHLPKGAEGVLRVDLLADLYSTKEGFRNKNIPLPGTSIIMGMNQTPKFISTNHAKIGQAISFPTLVNEKTYLSGITVLRALREAGLVVSSKKFWQHHLLYYCRLIGFIRLFEKIFKTNNFQEIHFCRFSDIDMQGLIVAAKKHGIRTIEYQHGVLSNMHPAIALIENSSNASTPDILNVSHPVYKKLSYGKAKIELIKRAELKDFPQNERQEMSILIAMQPRFSHEAVKLAIQLSKNMPDRKFVLRSHPRAKAMQPDLSIISKIENLIYETTESLESNQSLSRSSGIITGSSTMGIDAALQDIPCVFLHKEGIDQAQKIISNKNRMLSYAKTYAQLTSWVQSIQRL